MSTDLVHIFVTVSTDTLALRRLRGGEFKTKAGEDINAPPIPRFNDPVLVRAMRPVSRLDICVRKLESHPGRRISCIEHRM